MSALAIGRQMIEGWNAGDFQAVSARWDPYIVLRPDPNFPEPVCFGRESAIRFLHSQRDSMGRGEMIVEEEHDFGDRAFWRIHQAVRSPSGINSGYSWSFLLTVRVDKVILAEFYIDDAPLRDDLDLDATTGARGELHGIEPH